MLLDEEKKKKLLTAALVALAVSIVLAMFLQSVTLGETSINPIRWIAQCITYGFPFGIMVLIWLVMGGLVAAVILQKNKELMRDDRNFTYSEGGTYGTARLLRNAKDIQGVARIQNAAQSCGTILGQMDKTGEKIINQDIFNKGNHLNKHVCVFGASSSGKTYCYVKPFCFQAVRRRESVVLTDPKGELYEDMAEYFAKSGYIVRRFDLKNLNLSDGWDILAEIRDDPNRAHNLAEIIWRNITNDDGTDVFTTGPITLLTALLLRVSMDDRMKEKGEQNFGMAYQMLQNPEGEKYLDTMFDPTTLPKKAQACIGPYMTFKQASDNLRGNFLVGLAAQLHIFQSELVRKLTSVNDIDLTLPAKKPCAYFCILSDMDTTYRSIAACFFSFLFLDLIDYADNQPNRKCNVPVNFLLDEFANVGSIPEFDQKLATVRSRAVNVSIILQDISQLMGRYPKTYQSILSNCATHLCIGCNDTETAKHFGNRAGDATIQVRTDQHEQHESAFKVGNKHSTGEGKRAIFTTDELLKIGKEDDCLISWQGYGVMWAYKYPFTSHPEASRMEKRAYSDYPSIFDDAGRKALRDKENAYVDAYEKELAKGWNPLAYFGGAYEEVPEEMDFTDKEVDWPEKIRQQFETFKHIIREFVKEMRFRYGKVPPDPVAISQESIIVECDGEEEDTFEVSVSDVEDIAFEECPEEGSSGLDVSFQTDSTEREKDVPFKDAVADPITPVEPTDPAEAQADAVEQTPAQPAGGADQEHRDRAKQQEEHNPSEEKQPTESPAAADMGNDKPSDAEKPECKTSPVDADPEMQQSKEKPAAPTGRTFGKMPNSQPKSNEIRQRNYPDNWLRLLTHKDMVEREILPLSSGRLDEAVANLYQIYYKNRSSINDFTLSDIR